jgi:hypothetical protein
VLDEIIEIDGEEDRFVETAIDLTDAFAQAGSQIVVRVESTLDIGRATTTTGGTGRRSRGSSRPRSASTRSTTGATS